MYVIIDSTILAKKNKQLTEQQALAALHKQNTNNNNKKQQLDIDDNELIDGLDTYNTIKQQNTLKRQQREQLLNINDNNQQPATKKQWIDPDLITMDQRRPATYTILKNKGLTRYRSKTSRNPRVKSRLRYEKGLAKHHSRVQQYTGKQGLNYTGEATGIKRNTVKSTKL